MLIPIGGYFLAGGTLTGLGSNLIAFAPIILCVGAHIFMHKVMGKKCHGSKKQNDGKVQTPAILPVVQSAASPIPQVTRR
ncbi:DUF2933 domain-containing protein [Falsihalocynthiibacter arcticus]|nr:DUF2933 domain-containing protein [Falsihalocynthiibacter arcticus]